MSTTPLTDSIRQIADAIDAGVIDPPLGGVRFFLGSAVENTVRQQFLAARRAFPTATLDTSDDYYISLLLPGGAKLRFDKTSLGTKTTVTREIVEYVFDPELLAESVTA